MWLWRTMRTEMKLINNFVILTAHNCIMSTKAGLKKNVYTLFTKSNSMIRKSDSWENKMASFVYAPSRSRYTNILFV